MRPWAVDKGDNIMEISIHAPREGCDAGVLLPCPGCRGISIHAPREGCDLELAHKLTDTIKFQSTHPARGATEIDLTTARLHW